MNYVIKAFIGLFIFALLIFPVFANPNINFIFPQINTYLQQNATGAFEEEIVNGPLHRTIRSTTTVTSATMTMENGMLVYTRKFVSHYAWIDSNGSVRPDLGESDETVIQRCPLNTITGVSVKMFSSPLIGQNYTEWDIETTDPNVRIVIDVHNGISQREFNKLILQLRDEAAVDARSITTPSKPKIPAIKPHGPPVMD